MQNRLHIVIDPGAVAPSGWFTSPAASLLAAIIAAIVALLGLGITNYLGLRGKKQELKLKRLELELASVRSQIEEFYGPLFSLFQLHQASWGILCRVRDGLKVEDNPNQILDEIKHRAGEHIWLTSFSPVHSSILKVIRSKLHLLDSTADVELFKEYIQHVQMERIQNSLYQDQKINNASVRGAPFPVEVLTLVESGLRNAKEKYDFLKGQIAAI